MGRWAFYIGIAWLGLILGSAVLAGLGFIVVLLWKVIPVAGVVAALTFLAIFLVIFFGELEGADND